MGMPQLCNSGISRNAAINDVIQSIALEEAALAHILNAQGEALQWVLAQPCVSIDEFQQFQCCVHTMIEAAASFEGALQEKICCLFNCIND